MNHWVSFTDIYKEAFEHYKETEEKKFNSKFGSLLQDLHLSLEQPVLSGGSSYGSTSCKHQSMFAPNYRVVAACSSAFQKKNFCSPELKASDNLLSVVCHYIPISAVVISFSILSSSSAEPLESTNCNQTSHKALYFCEGNLKKKSNKGNLLFVGEMIAN